MAIPFIQTSFNGGEFAPQLFGEVDLEKYRSGVALARNFFVDYRGGLMTRPGSTYVGRARASENLPGVAGQPRLIPFEFSVIQTYTLELGNQYLRFWSNGGQVVEPSIAITGVSNATSCQITAPGHGLSNYDEIVIAGIVGMSGLNGKNFLASSVTTNTFVITDLDGNPVNSTSLGTYVSGGTASRVYTLATPWAAADLPVLKFSQSADVITFTHPNYLAYDLARLGPTNWTLTAISFTPTVSPPPTISVAAQDVTADSWTFGYVVTSVFDSPPDESVAGPIGTIGPIKPLDPNSARTITISWSRPNTGKIPSRYNIYKAEPTTLSTGIPAGATYGLIGTTTGLQFTDNNFGADFTSTPPLHQDPLAPGQVQSITVTNSGVIFGTPSATISSATGTGASLLVVPSGSNVGAVVVVDPGRNYKPGDTVVFTNCGAAAATASIGATSGTTPACSGYFQTRKAMAASTNNPNTLWLTRVGNYKTMNVSVPPNADDALTITLDATEINPIKHLVSMPAGLLTLTGKGAWLIGGGGYGSATQALSPTNESAIPQAFNGVSDLRPLVINHEVLINQARGSYVRDLSFNFYFNIYTGIDISVYSSHLFTGHTLTDWCYAEEPHKLVLTVRDDGLAPVMCFLKEQNVFGWTHWDTQGFYRSFATVPEGQENAVYAIVERYAGGSWKYFVERFHSTFLGGDPTRNIPGDVRLATQVDAGLSYPLTYPSATITPPQTLMPTTGGRGAPTYAAPSDINGNALPVTFTTSAGITCNVGDVLEVNGGVATVTTGSSGGTTFQALVTQNLLNLYPAATGNWSLTTPTTSVSGLDHLNGLTVSILADGNVQPQQTVVNGTVTLQAAATRIVAGLPFVCQFESLPLEAGQPTMQGRRKNIPALTVRMADTRGLKVGSTFSDLDTIKEGGGAYANPIPLFTGDHYVTIDNSWDTPGTICLQQDNPLPAQVLAIVLMDETGDTPA